MWRRIGIAIGGVLAILAAAYGQSQRSPATLDDLLTEVRGLRQDLARSSTSGIRAQLVVGRAQLQEQRIAALRSELAQIQFQLRVATQQRERTDTVAKDVEEGIRGGNLAADRVRQLERELADMKDRLL